MLIRKLARLLEDSSALIIFSLSLASLSVIGAADYLSGYTRTLLVFYLVPVGLCAWYIGARSAVFMSLLSVLTWVYTDFAAGAAFDDWVAPLWNGTIVLATFVVVAFLLRRLRRAITTLEIRVAERTEELTEQIAERQRLEQELLAISEREQRRIGHELHDSLCQHLTGTALAGQVLTDKLGAHAAAADAGRIVSLIEEGIDLTRGLARGLYPVELETAGLMSALEEFASATSARSGVDCRFECESPVPVRDADAAMHLYRIAQEATANAIRHGSPRRVTISLDEGPADIELRIQDDGIGLPPNVPNGSAGMGLRIMKHRSQIIGATFSATAVAGGGSLVTCRWPVR